MWYRVKLISLAALLGILGFADAAQAYIGPGAGLSAIGSLLSVIGVVALLIAGFIYYPLKRLFKKKKNAGTASTSATRPRTTEMSPK